MILQISKIKSREVKGREIKKIKCFYNHIPCVISLNPGTVYEFGVTIPIFSKAAHEVEINFFVCKLSRFRNSHLGSLILNPVFHSMKT